MPWAFSGQRSDATGLYFYNARYYSPLIGRFISADSIVPEPGNPQDLNRYSYVRGNPLKYTDPSGHFCIPCLIVAAIAAYTIVEVLANPDVAYAPGLNVDVSKLSPSDRPDDDIILCSPCYYGKQGNTGIALATGIVEFTPLDKIPGVNKAINAAIKRADDWVTRYAAAGTLQLAHEAAERGDDILPGLFRYGSTTMETIDGYQRHHLWPKELGGPVDGWAIYIRTASGLHTG